MNQRRRSGAIGQVERQAIRTFGTIRIKEFDLNIAAVSILFWTIVIQSHSLRELIHPESDFVPDFFQDYASARNLRSGYPVYSSHIVTAPIYLNKSLDLTRSNVLLNAHPPTSILLAVPFSFLPFTQAFHAWNMVSFILVLLSLFITFRELNIQSTIWSVCFSLAILIFCGPLWEQTRQGQLNAVLLLAITIAWAADRSENAAFAGMMIGIAASIKLFPIFFVFYFAWTKRYRSVMFAVLMFTLLTGIIWILFGSGAFRDYLTIVLPDFQWFRVGWNNCSLAGFWSRLFDPIPGKTRLFSRSSPIIQSPLLFRFCYSLSAQILVAIVAIRLGRNVDRRTRDLGFGLCATTMLLINPISWEHSLIILIPFFIFVGRSIPWRFEFKTMMFLTIFFLFMMRPQLVWTLFSMGDRIASPLENLTILPYQFYALLGFLSLQLILLKTSRQSIDSGI